MFCHRYASFAIAIALLQALTPCRQPAACFQVPHAGELIAALQSRGIAVYLISGEEAVELLAWSAYIAPRVDLHVAHELWQQDAP